MLVGSVTSLEEIDQIGPLVDLLELRLDYFSIEKKPKYPCIFTFRKKEEGGVLDIDEKARLEKIEKYLELEPEYLDIEADTDPAFIEKIASKVKLIGSYHDFEKTPVDLDALLNQIRNPHFSICKIALKANSTSDMLRLMLFTRNAKEPLAAMSLGEFGKPSRILASIMGSKLDYTSLHEEINLHRYDVKTLLETFHYRKLNPKTGIYALIGDPVEKSPGHIFHNRYFRGDAVYVKMIVKPSEVKEYFSLMRQLPFKGLSVTIPLKEVILPFLDEVSLYAKKIGAINTITIREGRWIGTNTDGIGALNAIEKHCLVKGKQVALLGAGGTARAIAYEALQRGAEVTIYNRSVEKAEIVAKTFGCKAYFLDDLKEYDLLINTIPPGGGYTPQILPNTIVMDVVIVPRETPIMKRAKELNCDCIYGEEMFIEQAVLQQKEWR